MLLCCSRLSELVRWRELVSCAVIPPVPALDVCLQLEHVILFHLQMNSLSQIGFRYDLVEQQRSGCLYSELCRASPEQVCVYLGGVRLCMIAEGTCQGSGKIRGVEVRAPLCQ